jgi:hypothetical protein
VTSKQQLSKVNNLSVTVSKSIVFSHKPISTGQHFGVEKLKSLNTENKFVSVKCRLRHRNRIIRKKRKRRIKKRKRVRG